MAANLLTVTSFRIEIINYSMFKSRGKRKIGPIGGCEIK